MTYKDGVNKNKKKNKQQAAGPSNKNAQTWRMGGRIMGKTLEASHRLHDVHYQPMWQFEIPIWWSEGKGTLKRMNIDLFWRMRLWKHWFVDYAGASKSLPALLSGVHPSYSDHYCCFNRLCFDFLFLLEGAPSVMYDTTFHAAIAESKVQNWRSSLTPTFSVKFQLPVDLLTTRHYIWFNQHPGKLKLDMNMKSQCLILS